MNYAYSREWWIALCIYLYMCIILLFLYSHWHISLFSHTVPQIFLFWVHLISPNIPFESNIYLFFPILRIELKSHIYQKSSLSLSHILKPNFHLCIFVLAYCIESLCVTWSELELTLYARWVWNLQFPCLRLSSRWDSRHCHLNLPQTLLK